jgi:predicted nucleic acid-binding protein
MSPQTTESAQPAIVRKNFYVDSSVLLHAALGTDQRALDWFNQTIEEYRIVSSALLRLETIRVLRRDHLDIALAPPFTSRMALLPITDQVLRLAASITEHVKTLDAVHLGTILAVDPRFTLASHDQNMLQMAKSLGIVTIDPIEEPREHLN